MFRNNKSKKIESISVNDLKLTRTETLYFLQFVKYTKELFYDKRLKSKPSFVFYTENSVDHVVLDYSLASDEDKMFLKTFFTKVLVGDTFTVTDGQYLDDTSSIEANLSATLKFKKQIENLIFAEVVSVTDKDADVIQYVPDFFINIPQISKAQSLQESSDTEIQALISLNPLNTAKSPHFLGLQPGDMVEILCPNSINNNKKFEVVDAALIKNQEVIYLNTTDIVQESLVGTPVILNLYQSSKIDIQQLTPQQQDNISLGCCVDSTNNISLPYHTPYQCTLRNTNSDPNKYVWNSGSCNDAGINLLTPVSSSAALTETLITKAKQTYDNNVLALKQGLQSSASEELDTFLKKKTIESDFIDNNAVFDGVFSKSPAVKNQNIFEKFIDDNLIRYSVPVVVDSNLKTKLTQAFLPTNLFPGTTEFAAAGVSMTMETNMYKLLNISYEAIITDSDIIIRTLDGNTINKVSINLHKNIITTIFESSLTGDASERILFSTDPDVLIPVTEFTSLGYGYLQIGRYHMFMAIQDTVVPLYMFTNTGKSGSVFMGPVSRPTLFNFRDFSY